MPQLQRLETPVLLSMIAAYAAYYDRELTEQESIDCNKTINLLQVEIATRRETLCKKVDRNLYKEIPK